MSYDILWRGYSSEGLPSRSQDPAVPQEGDAQSHARHGQRGGLAPGARGGREDLVVRRVVLVCRVDVVVDVAHQQRVPAGQGHQAEL